VQRDPLLTLRVVSIPTTALHNKSELRVKLLSLEH
jgi:hypothetical protein